MVKAELHGELSALAATWIDNPGPFALTEAAVSLLHQALRESPADEIAVDVEALLADVIDDDSDSGDFAGAVVSRAQSLQIDDEQCWHLTLGLPAVILTRSSVPTSVFIPEVCPVRDLGGALARCLSLKSGCSVSSRSYAVAPQLLWNPAHEGKDVDYRTLLAGIRTSPVPASNPCASLDIRITTTQTDVSVGMRIVPVELSLPRAAGRVEDLQQCCQIHLHGEDRPTHDLEARLMSELLPWCGEGGTVIPLTFCGPIGDLIPTSVWNRNTLALSVLQMLAESGTSDVVKLDVDPGHQRRLGRYPLWADSRLDYQLPIVALIHGEVMGRTALPAMCGLSPGHLSGCLMEHFEITREIAQDDIKPS